jgi:Ulp1 family protease
VFSTHFYSTLRDEGVDAVTKWTMKRGIDIFTKKMLFFPINKCLHWSLCVVVNPGEIAGHVTSAGQYEHDALHPCILFFDSLKMHAHNKIRSNIIMWLNSEWKRLEKSSTLLDPFADQSLELYAPKGE